MYKLKKEKSDYTGMIFSALLIITVTIIFLFIKDFNVNPFQIKTKDGLIDKSRGLEDEYLTDLAGGGYIKIKVKVETQDKELQEELSLRQKEIRSTILSIIRDKTREELSKPEGIEELRRSLNQQLNKMLNGGEDLKVFITEIVTY